MLIQGTRSCPQPLLRFCPAAFLLTQSRKEAAIHYDSRFLFSLPDVLRIPISEIPARTPSVVALFSGAGWFLPWLLRISDRQSSPPWLGWIPWSIRENALREP